MKTIQFASPYQNHVSTEVFVGSALCECGAKGGFHNGDIKQLPDADADILLRSPLFSHVYEPIPADDGEEVA